MQARVNAFFSTPDLAGLIQQLKHLCLFSANALVVEGGGGSGKTTLLGELFAACETQPSDTPVDFAQVRCRSEATIDELLFETSSGLGLSQSGLSAGEALTNLRSFSERLIADKKIAVLAFDDAHLLKDDLLAAILSLLDVSGDGSYGLRVVFFAEPGLMVRVDQIAMPDLPVYDFQLAPFSTSELERFLSERVESFDELQSAGAIPSLAAIWNRSSGAPGRALELVDELAASAGQGRSLPEYKGVPLLHLGALTILVTFLVLFLLYRGDNEDEAIDVSEAREAISPESTLSAGPSEPKSASILGAEGVATDNLDSRTELEDSAIENPVNTILSSDEAAEPRGLGGNDVLVDSSPVVAKEENKATDGKEAIEPEAEAVETNTQAKPDSSQSESDSALKQSEDFLMAQSGGYVLQLVAASKKESLLDYMAKQPNKEMLHIYRRAKGVDDAWFIVVIGPFDSKSAAQRARATLPELQKKAGPWPRNIEAVRQEITEFRLR